MSYQPKQSAQNLVASTSAAAVAAGEHSHVSNHSPEAPNSARQGQAEGRGEAALDSNGKSTRAQVDLERRGAARTLDRYRLQRHAAKVLDWPKALSACEYARRHGVEKVEVWRSSDDERGAWSRFRGVQTCKGVWLCPVCSNRRAWVRRGELQQLIEYAEGEGLTLVMLTLTSQHDLRTGLAAQREMMKKAKAGLTGRAPFKNGLRKHLVGSVTATEVTHGEQSGWHLHFHYILLLDLRHLPRRGSDDEPCEREAMALALGEAAWPAWEGAASCAGLYVHRHGFAVDVGQTVAAYPGQIEKIEGGWTLADEATRGAAKSGAGRHPFELLRLSCDENDSAARRLFVEYAAAMKNVSALSWSRGLKVLAGINEEKPGEDGEEPADKLDVVSEKVGELAPGEWQGMNEPGVRARRGRMSIAVARDGTEGFERERRNGKTDPHAAEIGAALADLGVEAADTESYDSDCDDAFELIDSSDVDTPPPLAECTFQSGNPRERGLATVGGEGVADDHLNDQSSYDVLQDRRNGVQHRISDDVGSR